MDFISLINNYHIEMQKEFTKKDLRSGMWVECQNGNRYLLIPDPTSGKLRGYRDSGRLGTEDYNEDLTFAVNEWDIMKIWHYDNPMNTNETDFGVDKLVWQRNDKKDPIKSKIDEIKSIVDEMQEDINEHLEKINKLKQKIK